LRLGREFLEVHGFRGRPKVWAVIREEQGKIKAYFYPDEREEATRLLTTAVLAKQQVGRSWLPLIHPQIEYSKESICQQERLKTRQIGEYLLAAKPEAEFEIGEKIVNADGHISISIGLKGATKIDGYAAWAGQPVYGKIVLRGEQKILFFWRSKEESLTEPPLLPAGHLMAERDAVTGIWKINLPDKRPWKLATAEYKLYLLTDAGARIYEDYWPAAPHISRFNNIPGRLVRRVVDNCNYNVFFPGSEIKTAFVQTRELCGVIKIADFWPSRESCQKGEHKQDTRIVAFKCQGKWERVNLRLKPDAVRTLTKKIPEKDLRAVFASDYMVDQYPQATQRIVDALKLY
ncbi:MAG: hypothetical protein PHG97_03215, partial [Candidatus Margulisbacteria bacterium]|nr:hypothetical protein [Candidatus Margulisiibacteriota bacterium]